MAVRRDEEVSQEQIQADVEEFARKLDILRVRYEQYFLGIERVAPSVLRTDVVRLMRSLEQVQIRNTAVKFRFRGLLQKFYSYSTYWNRSLREMEEGTFKRHRDRVRHRQAKRAVAEGQREEGQEAAVAASGSSERSAEVAEVAGAAESFLAALGAGFGGGAASGGREKQAAASALRSAFDVDDDDDDVDDFSVRAESGLKAVGLDPFGGGQGGAPVRPAAAVSPVRSGGAAASPGPAGVWQSAFSRSDEEDSAPTPVEAPAAVHPPSAPAAERGSVPGLSRVLVAANAPSPRELAQAQRPGVGADRRPMSRGVGPISQATPAVRPGLPGGGARVGAGPVPRGGVLRPSTLSPAVSSPAPGLRPGGAPVGQGEARPAGSAQPSRGAAGSVAPRPLAPPPSAAPPPAAARAQAEARPGAAPGAASARQLYDQFNAAREQLGMPRNAMPFDRFEQSLRSQEEKVRATHRCREVDFEVVVKDGKAVLKPKPKR